jgi:alkylation response protein AidB-like acyl-CoA dehydrogenase
MPPDSPESPTIPAGPDAIRAAVAAMREYAESMRQSAEKLSAEVGTIRSSVAELRTEIGEVKAIAEKSAGEILTMQVAAPRPLTAEQIVGGAAPATTPSIPISVSLSVPPMDPAAAASIRAIENTVTAQPTKKRTDWQATALAVLVLLTALLQHWPGAAK